MAIAFSSLYCQDLTILYVLTLTHGLGDHGSTFLLTVQGHARFYATLLI